MSRPSGRTGSASRGIGGGGKTSTKSPGSLSGYANKVNHSKNALGGNAGRADVSKDRQPKNMGSSGPKAPGPKYGRDKCSKTY